MKTSRCPDLTDHGRHEWYWKNILRRACPGVITAPCGNEDTHCPHWHGVYGNEKCRGLGLADVCEHGVQMLNQCDDCETETTQ